MADIKRNLIKKSILKKGFQLKKDSKNSGHDVYWLHYNDKDYPNIRVKISRGSSYRTYGQSLLGKMKKSLELDTTADVESLFNCPLSKDEYLAILEEKEII